MTRFVVVSSLVGLFALQTVHSDAANLISDGGFNIAIPYWTLQEYATVSGAELNTGELSVFTDKAHSGTQSLWLRAFAGSTDPNSPNVLTNAIMSQTVPGSVGEVYTFTGWSTIEANYSGYVSPLPSGPLMGQASPTQTNIKLEFLDSAGGVLLAKTHDLKPEFAIPNLFPMNPHEVSETAPSGTVNVRVTVEGRDMVNTSGSQSAFVDDFSLTVVGDPNEILSNPDLEDPALTGLESWTVFQNDPGAVGNMEIVRTAGFAARTGQSGMWLSSFFGEPATPVDGSVSQSVPGVEGGLYKFAGWSLFQENYSGGDPNSPTDTFMELAFLDPNGVVIGSAITLDVATEQMNNGGWKQHTLNGISPAGTASVRVSAGMNDGITTTGQQSVFFDDFELTLCGSGDFDCDGDVDGDDFLSWQRGESPDPLSASDLADWEANYGAPPLEAAAGAVPEPISTTIFLAGALIVALYGERRGVRNGG